MVINGQKTIRGKGKFKRKFQNDFSCGYSRSYEKDEQSKIEMVRIISNKGRGDGKKKENEQEKTD